MIFRKAKNKDYLFIKKIAVKAYKKYIPRIGQEPAPMRPTFEKNDVIFVCEKNSKIVAFAIIVTLGKKKLLNNIAVDPIFQQKKIGTYFIHYIEKYFKRKKVYLYELYTNEKMIENIRWYQKLGFKKFKKITEKGFKRVYFRKKIN